MGYREAGGEGAAVLEAGRWEKKGVLKRKKPGRPSEISGKLPRVVVEPEFGSENAEENFLRCMFSNNAI